MRILIISALAGTAGTGMGGLLAVLIGKRSSGTMGGVLSFAGGVMISVVCFGLLPESIELTGVVRSVVSLVTGILVIMLLNPAVGGAAGSSLLRSGIIMISAIALHNIPEGMAIGASGTLDMKMGALMAFMIAMHDIPEGMAIAAPFLTGGVGKIKAVALTALAGSATFAGGVIGVLVGNISNNAVGFALAFAGGAMLYVVFGEIIPQTAVMTKSKSSAAITLTGVIAGMILAQIGH